MDIFTTADLDAVLDALGASATFGSITLHLFSNNIVVGGANVLGDFTEAAWSGYAAQVVAAWGSASGGSGGTSTMTNAPASWTPGVLGSPEINYGWYATDNLGNLMGCGNFVSPLQMGGTTIALTITPSLTMTTP